MILLLLLLLLVKNDAWGKAFDIQNTEIMLDSATYENPNNVVTYFYHEQ